MSKIYDTYQKLKKQNSESNTLYLFKAGIFFLFVDQDAITMSQYLGLKLGTLNEKAQKCCFPVASLNKYLPKIQRGGYCVQIVDSSYESKSSYDYLHNQQLQQLIEEVVNTDLDTLSVGQTYEFLNRIQQELSKIQNQFS